MQPVAPSSIQIEAKTEATIFSRSTLAHVAAVHEQLVDTKKSMLDDMSKCRFASPSDVLEAIDSLQKIQEKVDDLQKVVESKSAADFTQNDLKTMDEMKRKGATEAVIAHRFQTNQTKVNRLLNGVVQPKS
jgi:hypothetical protein